MKKNQLACLNVDAELRTKSRQFTIGKQQLAKAHEPAELATKQAPKTENVLKEAAEFEKTNDAELYTDMPVFNDPRCLRDRRRRQSVFFSAFRDRRSQTRRGLCSLDTNWWISRNYCQPHVE